MTLWMFLSTRLVKIKMDRKVPCEHMLPNPSINTGWLEAGEARLQPAGYVRRWTSQ